jgi:hypothetical protein
MAVVCRLHYDESAKKCVERRTAEGKTEREIIRCLKAMPHARYSTWSKRHPATLSLFRFDGHRWCGGQAASEVS